VAGARDRPALHGRPRAAPQGRRDAVAGVRAGSPAGAGSASLAGRYRIELRAEPVEDGTLVSIDEHPLRGPAKLLHNPAMDLLVKIRNVETLRPLERCVQRHPR